MEKAFPGRNPRPPPQGNPSRNEGTPPLPDLFHGEIFPKIQTKPLLASAEATNFQNPGFSFGSSLFFLIFSFPGISGWILSPQRLPREFSQPRRRIPGVGNSEFAYCYYFLTLKFEQDSLQPFGCWQMLRIPRSSNFPVLIPRLE